MPTPTISYLTDVFFAVEVRSALAELLKRFSVYRPLVVTDQGLLNLGMVDRLGIEQPVVFADVPANPTEASVLQGVDVLHQAECDGIVALGGGSPMDCAKAIALKATHTESLEHYALIRGGISKIHSRKPAVVAVPTTAGTGSEVGRGALITMASGQKLAIIGKPMIPEAAICDPRLTLELPPQLTAATGMDAISHCIETYCSPKFNPVAEAIALDGLERACRFLPVAVADGTNLHARREMMMAALQGGLSFQKGLGMIHSLSHPLGSLTQKRLHHGTLNAIFLPHVLRFNLESCPEKMQRIAAVVGVKGVDWKLLPDFFARLTAEVGLPLRLAELGLSLDELEPLAEPAFQDHSTPTNPRQLTVNDCRDMLAAAF